MQTVLYKMEHAFVLVLSMYLFSLYGHSWLWFVTYLLLPDILCMVQMRVGRKQRQRCPVHSFVHSYIVVILLGLFVFMFFDKVIWALIGWIVHIALDRMVGGWEYPFRLFWKKELGKE